MSWKLLDEFLISFALSFVKNHAVRNCYPFLILVCLLKKADIAHIILWCGFFVVSKI